MGEWQLLDPITKRPLWNIRVSRDGLLCERCDVYTIVHLPFSNSIKFTWWINDSNQEMLTLCSSTVDVVEGFQSEIIVKAMYQQFTNYLTAYFERDTRKESEELLTKAFKAGFDMALEQLALAPIAGQEFRKALERNVEENGMKP
jgi:hypothetical protein